MPWIPSNSHVIREVRYSWSARDAKSLALTSRRLPEGQRTPAKRCQQTSISASGNGHMNACSYCDGDNFVLRCVFSPMYLRENGARNERFARQLIGFAFV